MVHMYQKAYEKTIEIENFPDCYSKVAYYTRLRVVHNLTFEDGADCTFVIGYEYWWIG
jgi:hypothetical protein